ncbi:hypothetical protein [Amycolatopsis japonica]|uniref:hypothetical protein n=1 Tax=Amycolatopsis japonica TaxID=208439 RepID=UPI0011DD88DC|nr:hypothetical protein [Amycolatopsis japonica]
MDEYAEEAEAWLGANDRHDVWMQVPGSKQGGWSLVASGVTRAEALVWQSTSLHKTHVEESKA